MIQMPGKGRMNRRFDWYEWSASIYETPIETISAMTSHGIIGKEIKSMHAIGHVRYKDGLPYRTRQRLGLSLTLHTMDGDHPFSHESVNHYLSGESTVAPAILDLDEPFVFEFSDGTSMELFPVGDGCLQIGFNSIPKAIRDGVNDSDFDVAAFFEPFYKGARIKSFDYAEDTRTTLELSGYDISRGYQPECRTENSYRWYINLSNSERFCLEGGGASYKLCITEGGNDRIIAFADRKLIRCSVQPKQQIVFNDGGDFGIFPVHSDNTMYNVNTMFPFMSAYCGIALSESEFSLIYPFAEKYFDLKIQQDRSCWDAESFDWYGTNLYTIPNFRKMLAEIKQTCAALKRNNSDSMLNDIRRIFKEYPSYRFTGWGLNETETAEAKRDINVLIRFYLRFCEVMEKSINYYPEFDRIKIIGP